MKTTKIYNNEKEVYSGNCYVNTVIFRGRIYDEFKKVGQNGIRFSLQLSNGKDPKTGKWNKPKDEIWLNCKVLLKTARRQVLQRLYCPRNYHRARDTARNPRRQFAIEV